MIDLRLKSLPEAITVDGKDFLIKTDFREWIKFDAMARERRPLSDYFYLFVDEVPFCDFFPQLLNFYSNPNSTPVVKGNSNTYERLVDYVEDGEYIVASFYRDYGIDLTNCEMHWHLFQALFIGLSEDSKIKSIMHMRGWKDTKKSYKQSCIENRQVWSLPNKVTEEEKNAINEINKLFYNA